MLVDMNNVIFQVDTGASVNLLPTNLAKDVVPTTKTLRMYNETEVKPIGTCHMSVKNPKTNKKYSVEFVVVTGDFRPILGLSVAEQMNLITVNNDYLERVTAVTKIDEFTEVFGDGIGTLEKTVHLPFDEKVTLVIMPDKRVPIAIRPKLKDELDRMTDMGVIIPVNEPTAWVS